ncbi:zinc ribbon domain-containing protein [Erwinia sp. 9145]|uniref:zinc ribbon domain-containing protein n=1 Tax=Erwinia sp. 9145 TaxID=1500895 RepID=UPI000907BC00|nr:zinc ribbon domain-containing protein [Erwinia sp. 9145]
MNVVCPQCQQPLRFAEGHFHCDACARDYAQQALCPDCNQPLQVLKACGATDYFCPNGHGLISKKRVVFVPLP